MGQKINPHGLRVGVIKDWDSRWFAKDEVFGDTLVEDYNLRKLLKKQLAAGVRKSKSNATPPRCAFISTARSRAWSSARAARRLKSSACSVKQILKKPVAVNIVEIKSPTSTRSWSPRTSPSSLRREFPSAAP